MYLGDGWGWSEVERIIVVICVVVRDEGCEVGVIMYVENGDWVK